MTGNYRSLILTNIVLKSAIVLFCSYLNIFRNFAQDCEVIEYTTQIRINNGKMYEKESIILQVNNRMGDRYTEFSLPYNKMNAINSIDAQIEDISGGVIRKIRSSEILYVSAVSSASLYTDDYLAIFEPKYNYYPYRIRVIMENTYKEFMSIVHWTPVKDHRIPTVQAQLDISLPESDTIYYRQQLTTEPNITHHNGVVTYSWKTNYTTILKDEAYSPPIESLLPSVVVSPERFFYEIEGSFKDWQSFGQWFFDITKDLDILTPEEKFKVDEITESLSSDIVKVGALFHYLQDNTRYLNVSIEVGGLIPYPAEYVCRNKYGDCKALTNYMKALLKEAGINSYYALIYADLQNKQIPLDHPEQAFNHAVLYVPLESDTLWLECTSKTVPLGYVHCGIQNRFALVIDSNKSRLIKTPSLTAEQANLQETFTYSLEANGSADLKMKIRASGEFFENMSDFDLSLSEHDKRMYIDYMFNFPRYDLVHWDISRPGRDSTFIYLTADLFVYDQARSYGNEKILKVISINIPEFETSSERSAPVQIDCPVVVTDSVWYSFPTGWGVTALPTEKSLSAKYGEYQLEYAMSADMVKVYRRFILHPGIYSLKEYPGFYSFITTIQKYERDNVLILKTMLP